MTTQTDEFVIPFDRHRVVVRVSGKHGAGFICLDVLRGHPHETRLWCGKNWFQKNAVPASAIRRGRKPSAKRDKSDGVVQG